MAARLMLSIDIMKMTKILRPGISTAPAMKKLMKTFPPRLDVLRDKPK